MSAGADLPDRDMAADDEAHLAALLAALALVRADGASPTGSGRTGGEALARWRAGRLGALRRPGRD